MGSEQGPACSRCGRPAAAEAAPGKPVLCAECARAAPSRPSGRVAAPKAPGPPSGRIGKASSGTQAALPSKSAPPGTIVPKPSPAKSAPPGTIPARPTAPVKKTTGQLPVPAVAPAPPPAAEAPEEDSESVFTTEVGGPAAPPPAPAAPPPPAAPPERPPRPSGPRKVSGSLKALEEPPPAADMETEIAPPVAKRSDELPAGFELGNCRIERLIGKGAMGRVYRAQHLGLARPMAVKVLEDALVQRAGFVEKFFAEARALAKLDHPNIVRVFDVDKDPSGTHYIVMELLEGGSVDEKMRKAAGPLPLDDVVRIGLESARGLHHAHQAGLVHRDVKPSNLMLAADGRVKVVDFGLAIPSEEDAFVTTSVSGTPAYMAPEQADCEKLDGRCDQYGLGATLFHLATGRLPFPKSSVVAIMLAHQTEAPPHPRELRPDIPVWLERVILTMLAKSPEDRFPALDKVVALFENPSQAAQAELPHESAFGRPAVTADEIMKLAKGLPPKPVDPPRWRPVALVGAASAGAVIAFLVGPGSAALGNAQTARSDLAAPIRRALDSARERAPLEKDVPATALVAAIAQLDEDIADAGARAGAERLVDARNELKTRLDRARTAGEKALRDRVAELRSRKSFGAAIEAANPEDPTLVALGLADLASQLRDDTANALASERDEVYVPAGSYLSGPANEVAKLPGFYIDRTEVTSEAYAAQVGKPGVAAPASWPGGKLPDALAKMPVTGITFDEARAFAAAMGKRLPTSAEWEKAARGSKDSRAYPWGERFEPGRANVGGDPGTLEEVTARPKDVSPFKVLGMAGNAVEWVSGDNGPLGAGGGYLSQERSARVFSRVPLDPGTRDAGLGFRCARDLEK
ncbi:MAG TPA: protein kinase [Planctomycetota bacterium]|nr:protein kinase [Planctomycetota bacterium]